MLHHPYDNLIKIYDDISQDIFTIPYNVGYMQFMNPLLLGSCSACIYGVVRRGKLFASVL